MAERVGPLVGASDLVAVDVTEPGGWSGLESALAASVAVSVASLSADKGSVAAAELGAGDDVGATPAFSSAGLISR